MKIIYLYLFLFFTSVYSQTLKVEYNENKIFNPQIVNKSICKLYVSKDFTYYKLESTEIDKKGTNDDPQTIIIDSDNQKDFSEILINLKDKILTERLNENLFLKKSYSVYEKQPVMKWKLLAGEKKISNYQCKKAETTFRGRSYIVWYTEKIPISSGPWKFSGLPGLILSVSDVDGIYNWDVKTIVYPFNVKEIDFKKISKENLKFKSISYKDFDTKRINAINEKIKTVKARNVNREGMKFGFGYSTFQEREPINEWRTQKTFN